VNVEIIRDAAKFEMLRDAWQALAGRAALSPFQNFDWLRSWMNTVGSDGRSICVVVMREGETLLATMPLTIRKYNGIRLLEWMGAKATDYNDILMDPQLDVSETCARLWECLEKDAGFDVARFGQVRTDAKIYAFLEAKKPWIETREGSVVISLTQKSSTEWLAGRSPKAREQINYGLRRMKRTGFEYHVCEPSENLTVVMDALIEQKRAWLKARNIEGLVSDEKGERFVRDAVKEMAMSGSLHLSVIRSEQHIAACHFGFMNAGVLYYYMPTYDPEFSKYSFGNLLRESLIMWACDHQLNTFDMLLGEHEYKSQYETQYKPVRTLLVSRTLVGRLAVAAYRFKATRSIHQDAAAGNE
jgi:CelD/BcsL family acetyltransferase involved in cellulose biosynthesis